MDEVKLSKRKLLTPYQLADLLSVSVNTIYGMVHRKEVKYIPVGGEKRPQYRILESSVRELYPQLFEDETDGSEEIPLKGG
jgi:excisionase family DNA binding protein